MYLQRQFLYLILLKGRVLNYCSTAKAMPVIDWVCHRGAVSGQILVPRTTVVHWIQVLAVRSSL